MHESCEAFDRTYFETRYRDYQRQNPTRKLAFYRRLVEKGIGGRPHARVLDIGCAFGLFLSQLDQRWERYGEDASDFAVRTASEKLPAVRFGVSASGNHPFAGPFDAITAWDVLEHVVRLDEMVNWIHQNLTADGTFAFVVPVYDGPTGPVIRFLDRDPTHVHKHERRYWLSLASERFHLTDWWGIYRFLFPGGFYLHLVTRALRHYSPAIACLLRRR